MRNYILQRFIVAAVMVVAAATVIFALLHIIPGDPVTILLGEYASEEQIIAKRTEMGLDRPLISQYVDWLGGVLRGDFGTSISMRTPISELLLQRFPRTLELTVFAIMLALLVGIPLGVVSGIRRGTRTDLSVTLSSLLALSVPTYVSGTLLVLFFSVYLGWLPASGYTSFLQNPSHHLKLLILPTITLAAPLAASIVRFTRSSVLEVLGLDHVRTARSKGLPERRVINGHVLRNSLLPVTTIVGLQAGFLLGGTLIVEVIFAWPGMGTLLFQSLNALDYPLVQACVLVISTLFIAVNLLVDIINGVIDPRARQDRKSG